MTPVPIRSALRAVTASLLGASAAHAGSPARTESSLLFYKERERTSATEFTFNYAKDVSDKLIFNARLTYDGLTGATPTGASPSKYPQTITRASGGTIVDVPAGAYPVDENFTDTRFALEAGLERAMGRLSTVKLGARWSGEHDYKSLGISGGATREFNGRNTALGVTVAYSSDRVEPVGGVYPAFWEVGADLNETEAERRARFAAHHKGVIDLGLSIAQVINRETLVRVNWSASRSAGYLTDPYKITSVVQPVDSADPGEPVTALYENRPADRQQQAVMGQLKRHFAGTSADLAYRFFWDDWGVRAHSVDVLWHVDFNREGMFTPHVRWYRQSQAGFYAPFLLQGDPLPAYASADSRLSNFDAWTFGLNYSIPVRARARLSFGMEYYLQRGDNSPPEGLNTSLPYELFPALDVVMVRVGYAVGIF